MSPSRGRSPFRAAPVEDRSRAIAKRGASPHSPRSESEILTQVDLTHLAIGKDLLRRSGGDHTSCADDVRAAADAERFPHVMVGDQHTDIARNEMPDDALDV